MNTMKFIDNMKKENLNIKVCEVTKNIIEELIQQKTIKNRGAFVKNAINKICFSTKYKYNVMVFNLAEEHHYRFEGIKTYDDLIYPEDGTIFGVWVFEYGTFENCGARGFDNWAFNGNFTRNSQGNKVNFKIVR